MVDPPSVPAVTLPPRLLDQLRQAALAHFGRPEPGRRFADWARRFILFHGTCHRRDMSLTEIARFLEHLAQTEKDPLAAIEQARDALDFLYQHLLHVDLGELPFPEPPRLLDRLRHALRVRHYSPRTEKCYVDWAERFIRFHGLRHPQTMGAAEIEQFLTDQAVHGHVSASRQNQGYFALRFLYRHVLGVELPRIDAVRARRPKRLPIVLSPEDVRRVLDAVPGRAFPLMAGLCYGAGLRREECCQLRVQSLDLARSQILVRHGKGGKDRIVMLPRSLRPALEHQLARAETCTTAT